MDKHVLYPFRKQVYIIYMYICISCTSFLVLWSHTFRNTTLNTGWRYYFGCQACKRTGMGYQCWWGVSSLFSRKWRWILYLCRHHTLHFLCFYTFKYFKVLSCSLSSHSVALPFKLLLLLIMKWFRFDSLIKLGFSHRIMIVDLDAHQGNGHETDFRDDSTAFFILHLLFCYLSVLLTLLACKQEMYTFLICSIQIYIHW